MNKNIEASELKHTDDYYYVQVFPRANDGVHRTMHFVVFADNRKEANEKAKTYLKTNLPKGTRIRDFERDVHLYLKDYIKDAQRLVRQGHYI